MNQFRNTNRPATPSDEGQSFTLDTPVTFLFRGQTMSGKIIKQLTHAAIVEVAPTVDNEAFMTKSNGVLVVNYKELHVQ